MKFQSHEKFCFPHLSCLTYPFIHLLISCFSDFAIDQSICFGVSLGLFSNELEASSQVRDHCAMLLYSWLIISAIHGSEQSPTVK